MFDIGKIADQIGEKIKPTLEQTKKQAELSLLANIATQIYCAETLRGGGLDYEQCVAKADRLINIAKKVLEA